MKIHERVERVVDDYLKFELVENKKSTRPDIHAFILLNEIYPSEADIISAASHDVIWLNFPSSKIKRLTDNQILERVRCGVIHNEEENALNMFT